MLDEMVLTKPMVSANCTSNALSCATHMLTSVASGIIIINDLSEVESGWQQVQSTKAVSNFQRPLQPPSAAQAKKTTDESRAMRAREGNSNGVTCHQVCTLSDATILSAHNDASF